MDINLLLHRISTRVKELYDQYPVPEEDLKYVTILPIFNPQKDDNKAILLCWNMAYWYFIFKYKLYQENPIEKIILDEIAAQIPQLSLEGKIIITNSFYLFLEMSVKFNVISNFTADKIIKEKADVTIILNDKVFNASEVKYIGTKVNVLG